MSRYGGGGQTRCMHQNDKSWCSFRTEPSFQRKKNPATEAGVSGYLADRCSSMWENRFSYSSIHCSYLASAVGSGLVSSLRQR